MSSFDIPVAIFFFRRPDTTIEVIKKISKIKPAKLYLICDGGRTEKEHLEVLECRNEVENHINWECEVIRNYASKNRGVYENIGKGAQWVLQKEEYAIFLEDDNLPELSFFYYCEELLKKYKENEKVLWICGTNYLEKYENDNDSSYVFTKHLMPCGWATWSDKFLKHYDGDLTSYNNIDIKDLKNEYENKSLYRQQIYNVKKTLYKLENDKKMASWDHQMAYSIRKNKLLGIAPKVNLIRNIGVDERSTHGGTSLNKVMTKRFCGMGSSNLHLPLTHPSTLDVDPAYEKLISKIILLPLHYRIFFNLVRLVKPILGLRRHQSIKDIKRGKRTNDN